MINYSSTEDKPYSFRQVSWWKLLWWRVPSYEILFEDTVIRKISRFEGSENFLAEIVFLLNAAYKIGHANGWWDRDCQDDPPKLKKWDDVRHADPALPPS